MILTQEQFNALVDEIMTQGFDVATAASYAGIIGDTPEIEDGLVVVRSEDGEVLARLKLKGFSDEP